MEQLLVTYKKSFSFLLIFLISFSLAFGFTASVALAQTTVNTNGTSAGTTVTGPTGTQANTAANGVQNDSGIKVDGGAALQNGVAGCAASIVAGAISGVASQLLTRAQSSDVYTSVKINSADTTARAGDSSGWPPSLDSIGYCMINAVIDTLTQATLDWINSGFDGNPAFVTNPEQFFKDIADVEAASFLQEVVGGVTGVNICEPFRLNIVTGLAGGQSSDEQFKQQSSCTLDQISSAVSGSGVGFDYQEYTSGNSVNGGNLDAWWGVTQNKQNTPYGAYLIAQQELQKRLSVKENAANLDLTMGRGFLSYKKCSEDGTHTNPDGTTGTHKGVCTVSTPGTVIEQQLNNRLSSGNNRLVVADKFDQVITALVDQLIKVALNEVLTSREDGSTSGQ